MLALALAGLYPGGNSDTFGHLAQGRQIVALGRVPAVDTWSLLPGEARAWHNYEWLSDWVYYQLYAAFGYDGLIALKVMLLAASALLLLEVARRFAGSRAVVTSALLMVAAVPAVRFRLSDRPHLFGLALSAAYLLLLGRLAQPGLRRGRAALLLGTLGVLHVAWLNLHGSHLLGMVITGAFLLCCDRSARPWLGAALGIEGLSCFVSPYGPAIVLDALRHVFDARYREVITEWSPWRDSDPLWLALWPALHAGLLALSVPRLLRAGRPAYPHLALAAVLAVASLRSIRFVAEFVLLTAPVVGWGLSLLVPKAVSARRAGMGWTAAAVVLIVLVPWGAAQLPPYVGVGCGARFAGMPRAAGAFLTRHQPQPRVLASMQDGWFLMFAAPHARFFMDGRVPFYGPEHAALATRAIMDARVFRRVAEQADIDTVVLDFTRAATRDVVRVLSTDPGFVLAVVEDVHATFIRGDRLRGPALEVMVPSYDVQALFDLLDGQKQALLADVRRLARLPGTAGIVSWVRALRELSRLRRARPQDGLRWPAQPEDWQRYRRAQRLIRRAAQGAESVPIVSALRGLVAATLCDFEEAREALSEAEKEGPSRETILAQHEIALRMGEVEAVRAFVELARAQPQAQGDGWLAALQDGLRAPPSCPPASPSR